MKHRGDEMSQVLPGMRFIINNQCEFVECTNRKTSIVSHIVHVHEYMNRPSSKQDVISKEIGIHPTSSPFRPDLSVCTNLKSSYYINYIVFFLLYFINEYMYRYCLLLCNMNPSRKNKEKILSSNFFTMVYKTLHCKFK